MNDSEPVAELGEFGLIDRIAGMVGGGAAVIGIGDDAAVLDIPGDDYLLATVDMLVQDVHFISDQIDPVALGRRAVAVNISDIAAMGGSPTFALTSIAVPSALSARTVEDIYRGMRAEADAFGVSIVGGNVARSSQIVLDVVLLGRVAKSSVVLRSGARIGDVLMVTGVLGQHAGLRTLAEQGNPDGDVSWVPTPRIGAGAAVAKRGLAHAMMDISDGLASDLRHLCDASGVGAVVVADDVPIGIAARKAAAELEVDPLDIALAGGEDYELLMAVDPAHVEKVRVAAGDVPAACIGTVLAAKHGFLLEVLGGAREELPARGWRHF